MTKKHVDHVQLTRRAAVGAISGAVVLQPLQAHTDNARKVISLEAPDDVFVQQLTPDGAVQANQVLMTLRSPTLDRFQARITMLQSHMEIVQRPLHDGRIDASVKSLKDKAAALQAAKTAMDDDVQATQWMINHGEIADKRQLDDV